jgi:hypothetical protein
MPRTLRQHVQEAERIMSIGGVRTLIPQKGLPAPIRIDASDRQREYAVSIRLVVSRCDSTRRMGHYLRASDDVREEVWRQTPEGMQGKVKKDMRRARKMLREGGIPVASRN